MSDLPKMLSKREIELEEVNYIFSLRAERDELQERCDRYEKALTEICEFDCSDDCYFTARDALAAIGNEGSGDE
ncbi:hypothetical protein [Lactococcus lactis]|uniref:hypothetical protein n=1 Tax=Lactococcus lactis TaxID=1358 RepID=UPI0032E41951